MPLTRALTRCFALLISFVLFSSVTAPAETGECRTAIAKASTSHAQARHKILQKCVGDSREAGDPPSTALATCTSDPKVAHRLLGATTRLYAAIGKACGGDDGLCGGDLTNEDTPASFGWPAECPNIENGPCTGIISTCTDVAGCIECIDNHALDRLVEINYQSFLDQPAGDAQNACQVTVTSSLLRLFHTRSKTLARCWDSALRAKPGFTTPCPEGDSSAKTQARISAARPRSVAGICKECGGIGDKNHDVVCDGSGSDPQLQIGFGLTCPPLQTPNGPYCGVIGPVDTLQSYVDCVTCVTEFYADCGQRAGVLGDMAYPAECNPLPQLRLPGTVAVGADAKAAVFVSLTVPAPPGDVPVTLTSADPSRLLISASADVSGSASVTLGAAAGGYGAPKFFVQSLAAIGSVDITATAPGYSPAASLVNLEPPGAPRATVVVPTPVLDVAALHEQWAADLFPPGTVCTWPSYTVGAASTGSGAAMAGLPEALGDSASQASACGPTIYVGPGRYTGPPLEITQPTILVGEAGSEISATVVSTQGKPLWIQDFELVDAPYPAAVFASHPDAQTTLVRVEVTGSTGIGVVHNGGSLSMWESSVRDTRITDDPLADPRVSRMQILGGYGQIAATSGSHAWSPPVYRLGAIRELARKDSGPSFDPILLTQVGPDYDFLPLVLDPPESACMGTGIRVTNDAYFEASNTYVVNNATAGLVVDDSFAELAHVLASTNGRPSIAAAEDGSLAPCFGGILATNHTVLLAEIAEALDNYFCGACAADSYVSIGFLEAAESKTGSVGTIGGVADGFVDLHRSFVSLKKFQAHDNPRAGLTFVGSTGNIEGKSYANKYGMVLRQKAAVFVYAEGSDFNDNETAILPDGDLPTPNAPLPIAAPTGS